MCRRFWLTRLNSRGSRVLSRFDFQAGYLILRTNMDIASNPWLEKKHEFDLYSIWNGNHSSLYMYHEISVNTSYRVSHSEECKVNQLWGIERSIILLNYGAKWLQELINFEFHESVFKKVTLVVLSSLWQKRW